VIWREAPEQHDFQLTSVQLARVVFTGEVAPPSFAADRRQSQFYIFSVLLKSFFILLVYEKGHRVRAPSNEIVLSTPCWRESYSETTVVPCRNVREMTPSQSKLPALTIVPVGMQYAGSSSRLEFFQTLLKLLTVDEKGKHSLAKVSYKRHDPMKIPKFFFFSQFSNDSIVMSLFMVTFLHLSC
jgi:hypothetical protein